MNIELKPIAESKVRQLGGDVCWVLVRKDGRLAVVDEHGRVQWLQSGRGADPIGFPGSLERANAVFAAYREDFPRFGKRLDGTPAINDLPVRVAKAFSDLCPQPAQQGGAPSRDDLVQCLLATRGQSEGVAADAILSLFSATTPQPEGDAVAVPVAALEYLKDQWPGAYAKLYERICSNKHPQPPQEGEGDE